VLGGKHQLCLDDRRQVCRQAPGVHSDKGERLIKDRVDAASHDLGLGLLMLVGGYEGLQA